MIVDRSVDEIQVALPVRSCLDEFEAMQAASRGLGVPITFRLSLLDDSGDFSPQVESDPVVAIPWHYRVVAGEGAPARL